MTEQEIKQLWQSTHEIAQQNAEDISKLKTTMSLTFAKPIKLFAIIVGLMWVCAIDTFLFYVWQFASIFFIISAGIQVLLTKWAIGLYLYQWILLQQIDVSEPIVTTQERLARLKSSTLLVARILFLQLPLWTTFYWNEGMWQASNLILLILQGIITFAFTYLAFWLFVHIRYENRNKLWFRFIFNGKEWQPILDAIEQYQNTQKFKQEA